MLNKQNKYWKNSNICLINIMMILNLLFSNCQVPNIRVSDISVDNQSNTSIVVNPNNKEFIIFFQSITPYNDWDIYGKIFNTNGNKLSEDIRINNLYRYDQSSFKTALLTNKKILSYGIQN